MYGPDATAKTTGVLQASIPSSNRLSSAQPGRACEIGWDLQEAGQLGVEGSTAVIVAVSYTTCLGRFAVSRPLKPERGLALGFGFVGAGGGFGGRLTRSLHLSKRC
jgi:hypothetical protein